MNTQAWMQRKWLGLAGVAVMFSGLLALAVTAQSKTSAQSAPASMADKWLHVRVVEQGGKGETVRVNVPLSLAEAILPALKINNKIDGGRLKIRHHDHDFDEIDFRAAFEAVKKAPDGEFVTVQKGNDEEVRVSKQGGYLLVAVRDENTRRNGEKRVERVDVKVPMTVAEALFSGQKDELDILAAVRALARHGDTQLVAVEDGRTTVRVWVDSKNVSE